jgi:hypothetical protein
VDLPFVHVAALPCWRRCTLGALVLRLQAFSRHGVAGHVAYKGLR